MNKEKEMQIDYFKSAIGLLRIGVMEGELVSLVFVNEKCESAEVTQMCIRDRVLFADGSIDTLTLDFWHDDDISHLSVGDVVKQGEHAQTAGSSGAATAVHLHVEAGRGKLKLTPGKSPLIPSTCLLYTSRCV